MRPPPFQVQAQQEEGQEAEAPLLFLQVPLHTKVVTHHIQSVLFSIPIIRANAVRVDIEIDEAEGY